MPQVPKEHVRSEIVRAALSLFAEVGYEAASMAAVAERAGVSTGNVYRYFEGKPRLFAEAVPERFAAELAEKTRGRMAAVGAARSIDELPGDAPYHGLSAELVDFAIEHRERVIVLLARAEGTPLASFGADLARKMAGWALDYARAAYPGLEVGPALRFAVGRIYEAYVASLAAALASSPRPSRIRASVALLSAHHLGGLARLFETSLHQGATHGTDDEDALHDPRLARSRAADPEPAPDGPRAPRGSGRARRRR